MKKFEGENHMKICNQKIVTRWNNVMNSIGCEHITIGTRLSELESCKEYYDVEDGVSVEWMLEEAKYWLSCYYEEGNVRCDDRFIDKGNYAIWVSETGKLKRFIAMLEQYEILKNTMIVEW